MTMALPLLPSNLFQEALNIIQNEADQLSNEYPDILQFMSYLRLNWLPAASKISTYRCPVRTNNIVESFHNTMTQKLGTRSNIWMFLGNAYIVFGLNLSIKCFRLYKIIVTYFLLYILYDLLFFNLHRISFSRKIITPHQ